MSVAKGYQHFLKYRIASTVPTNGPDYLVYDDDGHAVDALEGDDTVHSGSGADTLLGSEGNDLLDAGGGADHLDGDTGEDTLIGGAGEDTLQGGSGNDILNGGPDSDTFYVDDLGDVVVESNRWAGTDTVISSVDFRMGRAHIENLTLIGDAYLGVGNGLNNTIVGSAGANLLDGGRGIDRLVGGDGDDIYIVRNPRDATIEHPGGGTDTVKSYIPVYGAVYDIENVYLQAAMTKAGTPLQGMTAIGNAKANVLVGNMADNVLIGREGHDVLRGQAGADTFVFDEELTNKNVKTIIDFNTNELAEGDIIKIRSWELGVITHKNDLEPDYFYEKGLIDPSTFVLSTAAESATDRFIFDQASGRLWFDPDGDGAVRAQLLAFFQNDAEVSAASLLLY